MIFFSKIQVSTVLLSTVTNFGYGVLRIHKGPDMDT